MKKQQPEITNGKHPKTLVLSESTELQMQLCVNYREVGDKWMAQQNFTMAKLLYLASLEIAQELAGIEPENTNCRHNLSLSHEKLGDVCAEEGFHSEALRQYKVSLGIREKLADQNPDNTRIQRDLWVAYWRVSDILEQTGNDDAIIYWHKTYQAMNAMKKNGLNIAPEDEQYLEHLRHVFGKQYKTL